MGKELLYIITTMKKEKLTTYNNLFETLFDLSVQGIFIEDEHGNVLACNNAANKMFGYAEGEMIGKNVKELVSTEIARTIPDIIPDSMATGEAYQESINKRKDGSLFATQVCTRYISIDNKKRLIAYVHDISEQKKIQKQLEESKKQLEEEIQRQNKFFSIVAHDLRNPMSSILGFAQIIKKRLFTLPKEKIAGYIDHLLQAAENSGFLLENLLNWSLSHRGKLKPLKKVENLSYILQDTIQQMHEQALRKKINILADLPEKVQVKIDSNMIAFVFRNLLSNAIKFTEIGGTIKVKTLISNGQVETLVIDSGIGMTQQEQKALFTENIGKSQPGTIKETGTGLGLILSKEFLEYHNSILGVESKPQAGSTFRFHLKIEA